MTNVTKLDAGRSECKRFNNISAGATNVLKTGPGRLLRVVFNKKVASTTITLYDNTAASGTKIATITNPATLLNAQDSLLYDLDFQNGLTVVTSGADDITVVFE